MDAPLSGSIIGNHTFNAMMATGSVGDDIMPDEDAEKFLKTKRQVDILHKAKKMEKLRPSAKK